MNPFDPTKPPPSSPAEGVDDIIELTEVVDDTPAETAEDAASEVVLDFHPDSDELASLKSSAEPGMEKPETPAGPGEETLDDFLASLPDLPEDLDITPETMPFPRPGAPDLRPELAQRLVVYQL